MALISKIRKNFWLLLLVIGFALASFILMDASGPGGGGGQGDTTMGVINGKKIDYMDYQLAESTYYQGGQGETFSKRATIWNYFVEKTLLSDYSDKLGLAVGDEEMENLQFGAAPSPIIQQNWGQNPQALSQYKAMLDDGSMGNKENQSIAAFWRQQSQQIGKAKIQDKLSNLVSKAIYTPSWMASASYKDDNTKVDFQYVKIPFDAITTTVALSDADYQNFIDNNPSRFNEKVETRNIEYAVFNVEPTAQDSADILAKVNATKAEFAKPTTNDSIFTIQKGGVYNPIYYKTANLLESMKEPITTMEPGQIYGPYVDQNAYVVFKLIDAINVADTVMAQQILINADPNNEIQVTNANNKIDSLERLFKRGVSFDSLAIKNSQDGSAFNGGDMGVLTQIGVYQANPPLAKAIFYGAREGDIIKVESPQGIHLVKINDMTFSDDEPEYKVAMISEAIVPSQKTQNEMSDLVSELILGNRDMESMRTAVTERGGYFQTSAPVKENDFSLDALGAGNSSREIIKWAYNEEREVGDISGNVHTYTDPVLYYDSKYVIAALKSINPKGKQTVASLKSALEPEVMNLKKAEALVSGLNVSSLDDLASQYSSTVETASNASLGSPFIPGIGNEPDVASVAYATPDQTISKPIIGKTGVFVVKPISKSEAGDVVNLPSIKSSLSSSMRSQVGFKLMDALKNKAKVEDNRTKFF